MTVNSSEACILINGIIEDVKSWLNLGIRKFKIFMRFKFRDSGLPSELKIFIGI